MFSCLNLAGQQQLEDFQSRNYDGRVAGFPGSLGLWIGFLVADAIKDGDFCCVLTTG